MKKATPILLTLSLLINVALGVLLFVGTSVLNPGEVEENLTEIRAAGTYGPEGIRIVEGDATISSAGVVLQNALITGNLVLTKEIGDGSLQLKNVTVKGTMVVNGGGEASILLEDVVLEDMVVNRPDKQVRIVAKGNTTVKNVTLETGALLEEDLLVEGANGFMAVVIATAEEVKLAGSFTQVGLQQAKSQLLVKLGKVDLLLVPEAARDAYIEFSQDAGAGRVELLAASEVAGSGALDELEIRGLGLRKLAGHIGSMLVSGQGVFVEFTQGRTENLTVGPSEGTVSLQVPENVIVAMMELNGKASVTGTGTLESVIINENGSTIDQTPGKVELAKGITALVGGKELPEAAVAPKPKPTTPTTPRVGISSISNIANLYVGESGTRSVTTTPGDASITAKSSNTGVATVSVSGKTLTITAVKAGTATISVTAKKAGYSDRTVTFSVSVVGPTSIKSFRTEPGISPGKTLVIVEIWAKSPQNYSVTVKGIHLTYNAGTKRFFGEVNTEDAKRSNVKAY